VVQLFLVFFWIPLQVVCLCNMAPTDPEPGAGTAAAPNRAAPAPNPATISTLYRYLLRPGRNPDSEPPGERVIIKSKQQLPEEGDFTNSLCDRTQGTKRFPPKTCKALKDVLATFKSGDWRGAKQKYASYKADIYMPTMTFAENTHTHHPGGFTTMEVDDDTLLLHTDKDGVAFIPVLEDTQVYGVVRRFQKYNKLLGCADLGREELKTELGKLFYFHQESLSLLKDDPLPDPTGPPPQGAENRQALPSANYSGNAMMPPPGTPVLPRQMFDRQQSSAGLQNGANTPFFEQQQYGYGTPMQHHQPFPGTPGPPMPMQSPAGGFWPHPQPPTPAPAAPAVVDVAAAMLQQLPDQEKSGFAQYVVEMAAKEKMAQGVAQTAQNAAHSAAQAAQNAAHSAAQAAQNATHSAAQAIQSLGISANR